MKKLMISNFKLIIDIKYVAVILDEIKDLKENLNLNIMMIH